MAKKTRKDPRTGLYFFRKQLKHPITGKTVRLYKGGFEKASDCEEAERAAILALTKPERGHMPTFHDWFHGRFWTEWVVGGPRGANSPAEQESKRYIYEKWLAEFFGPLPLDRIDIERINTFRARLRAMRKKDGSPQLKEKTINNILAVLSTPLQYASKAGILMRAPYVGVAKVERPEIGFVEMHEVATLVRAAAEDERPEMHLAVLLAYEAGLRIGEIRGLEWKHVDMKARTITVAQQVREVEMPWDKDTPATNEDGSPRARYQKVDLFGPPKGRRRRVVPMTPALYEALSGRVRPRCPVALRVHQRGRWQS